MAITFRYDAAGVVPPSNESTRKYGQSLVLQQQQQKYAGQQAGYDRLFRAGSQLQQQNFMTDRDMQEQRARDFDAARSRLDAYARDMLANGEITDPDSRRKIQGLIAGKTAVMGSGFDQTARQEYLDQYNAQLAGILSGVPVNQKPTEQDLHDQSVVVENGIRGQRNAKGEFVPFPQQEQPVQPPMTAADAFRADPKLHKQYIEDSIRVLTEDGMKPLTPEVRKKASTMARELYDSDYGSGGGQPASTNTGVPSQQDGRGFTYQGTPDVGDYRGAQQPANNWFAAIEEQVAGGRMTPQQISALNAQTDASLADTNALLADNQARGRAVADQYAPRTDGMRRQADAMSAKTDRAESALRGELMPRSPQGERPTSMYDISDAQDKRDAAILDEMKRDGDAYKKQRSTNDAKLTGRSTNPIADPKQLKRDSAKFTADYQIYKRGGGTLSTRDYIMQRAAQGTLSDDLTRQLQENYGMDLSSKGIQGVVEQDLNAPREQAMGAAKAKRNAEENRKRRARGLPPIQQAPPVAPPVPVDTTRPTRGLPGGSPKRPSQKYATGASGKSVDAEQQALAQKLRDGMNGKLDRKIYDAAWEEWIDKYGNRAEADRLFAEAEAMREANGGEYTEEHGKLFGQARSALQGPFDPFSEETSPPTVPSQKPVTAAGKGKPNYLSDEEASGINERFAQGRSVGQSKSLPMPNAPEPNFGKLFANAEDDADRAVLGAIQKEWANAKSPDIKSALGVLVNPDAEASELRAARDYLVKAGIDIDKLVPRQSPKADDNSYLEAPYLR
jgi:hypothetical protein